MGKRRRYVWTAEEFARMNGQVAPRPRRALRRSNEPARRAEQSRSAETASTYARRVAGLPPVRLILDTVDGCNLRCTDCPSGARPREPRLMPIDLFVRVLRKFKSESPRAMGVSLFNWGEPFLNPRLAEYVATANAVGLRPAISTNFSLREIPVEDVIRAGVAKLIVSVSGWSRTIHKRYHRGSNIDIVRGNLERAAEAIALWRPKTVAVVRFLLLRDNQNELRSWQRWCSAHEFRLDAYPAVALEDTTEDSSGRLIGVDEPRSARAATVPAFVATPCPLHRQVVVGVDGFNYLCCKYWNHDGLRIGSYVDESHRTLAAARATHAACRVCKWRQGRRHGAVGLPESITKGHA